MNRVIANWQLVPYQLAYVVWVQ